MTAKTNGPTKHQDQQSRIISKDLNLLMEEYTSKLEEKVAFESQFFRLMADAMPQIVWTTGPDGKADYFNRRWYEYTGTDESILVNRDWLPIMHPDDVKPSRAAWARSINTGEPLEIEYRLKDSDTKEYRWFLVRALPGRDKNGQIIKWFGTCTDIHEQKELQERKDEFVAIASHELKTPLTSIKTFMHMLTRNLEKTAHKKELTYLTHIDDQLERLQELINDLLDVSMIDSGKLILRKEIFDFDDFVEKSVDKLQLLSDRHKINLTGRTGKEVKADIHRIEQVIDNFISNAIKYSPNAGKIDVELSCDKKYVSLCVTDFGFGIPKKDLPHLFDRFFRVEMKDRETFSGLGLGLYIAAEIIRREGGKIWAKSKVGEGSSFGFTLPFCK